MLPNRFPDGGLTPEYNTVDATLWYFAAIYRYYEATEDLATVRDKLWDVLDSIIQAHQRGTRYGIHVDSDSLLYAGAPGVQLTWMDAKIGDWVVTARTGKPVEINALWQNALRTMAEFARLLNKPESADRYDLLAQTHAGIFKARYLRLDGIGLYDVLDTPPRNTPDEAVRPNQIFAVSLPFPVLDPNSAIARSVVRVVQEQLFTTFGLRTLSPKDSSYRPRYSGSPGDRDSAYHQGTAWPWLLGAFAEAHFKVFADRDKTMSLLGGMEDEMSKTGMGSLSEVYDGGETSADSPPQNPGGCIAQAWSVAEILRVWMDLEGSRRKK
jgi:predicted glycogen debranching enzyme